MSESGKTQMQGIIGIRILRVQPKEKGLYSSAAEILITTKGLLMHTQLGWIQHKLEHKL